METENEPGMVRPWLLVVLVIVILVGIGFFTWNHYQSKKVASQSVVTDNTVIVTPTPDTAIVVPSSIPSVSSSPISTADWKTYTDATYSFNFKYPANWQIDKQNLNSTNLLAYYAFMYPNQKDLLKQLKAPSDANLATEVLGIRIWSKDSKINPEDVILKTTDKFIIAYHPVTGYDGPISDQLYLQIIPQIISTFQVNN